VLEIGCGDGGNLLSMAQALPRSRFVGIDVSPAAIGDAEAMRTAIGAANVTFTCCALEDFREEGEWFDYAIAHGVYSWVPGPVREALLATCRRVLGPNGVAFVSYAAYPGSYLHQMVRDVLRFHVRASETPLERIAGAHQFIRTIISANSPPTPYSEALRFFMQQTLTASETQRAYGFADSLLFHDSLSETNKAFYFHEFVNDAARHELQFLSEARPTGAVADASVRGVAAAAPTPLLPARLAVEQYFDFFTNRPLRQTLLSHVDTPVHESPDLTVLDACFVAAPDPQDASGEVSGPSAMANGGTAESMRRSLMAVLSSHWPSAVAFEELEREADKAVTENAMSTSMRSELAEFVYAGLCSSALDVYTAPPPVAHEAPCRPCASSLARRQCEAGRHLVSTLFHKSTWLDEARERTVLTLLDGTRDEGALVELTGLRPGEVQTTLRRLVARGLICAPASEAER
jgi:SAM-dependent methyltransferase/methyltransferase-like protein